MALMEVEQLGRDEEATLRRLPFSYADVGRTMGPGPAGYHSFTRTARLAREDLDAAGEDLLTWQIQLRAGLRVAASEPRLTVESVVLMRLGRGPISLRIPCRVVHVIDEPTRRGFAYGTLPGHPEAGEELFLLEQRTDGGIDFTVAAFSRPATTLARWGGPVSRGAQRMMTARYLRAADQSG